MRYYDKNGNEIKAGITIRMEDGSLELVYATEDSYGNPNLGINATNEAFMAIKSLFGIFTLIFSS